MVIFYTKVLCFLVCNSVCSILILCRLTVDLTFNISIMFHIDGTSVLVSHMCMDVLQVLSIITAHALELISRQDTLSFYSES